MAWIIAAVGVVMVIVGISVYVVTSNQLRDQRITVAAVTADNPGRNAGKEVAGPFTALSQINAISHHVSAATGGKTYGELGNVATSDGQTYSRDVTAATSTDGQAHSAGDPLSEADAKTYAARATAQTGSFLQASLYVSVLAFGVATLIIGLGIVFVFVGITVLVVVGRRGRSVKQESEKPAAAVA